MNIRIHIQHGSTSIEVTKLKVCKKEAAAILGCSRNLFDEKYVKTGLIIPVKDPGFKREEFWVQDLIGIRERQYEIESRKKRSRVLRRRINYTQAMNTAYAEMGMA